MTWVILLAAVGLTMISLEIIIPGGILGAIGAMCTIAACVVSFSVFEPVGGLIATAIILVATGLLIWLVFKVLSKTVIGQRAFLKKSVSGVSSSYGDDAKELIGRSATAMTTLAPSGYIDIAGERYEAYSQSGLTKAGTALKVVAADNFRLIVEADTSDRTD
ncbi:MAG: NfeD family protein [Akkermansiaceae bacterium]|nr:NfeD family protein [Akkermansiaceae bacterium]